MLELLAVFQDVLRLVELGDGAEEDFRAMNDHLRKLTGAGRYLSHLVGDEAACDRVQKVEDVIQGRTQGVDVLPVKRGDESLVQLHHQPVSQLVALMFHKLDLGDALFHVPIVLEQRCEFLCRLLDVLGLFAEQVVKFPVARYQLHGCPLRDTRD